MVSDSRRKRRFWGLAHCAHPLRQRKGKRADEGTSAAPTRWLRAWPVDRGGERELAQNARKAPLQGVIRVGVARLIRNDRDEDLSVHSSRQQPQQSTGLVHRRLGHPWQENPHGEEVGVAAVRPVGA